MSAVETLGEYPPSGLLPTLSEADAVDPDTCIFARRTPEPPAFERALQAARALVVRGDVDKAWASIQSALTGWYPTGSNRIAPVALLNDPLLRPVITPNRARKVVFTPRGGASLEITISHVGQPTH